MNNPSDPTTADGPSEQVLAAVPLGTPAPAMLTQFRDCTIEESAAIDGVRVGLWFEDLQITGGPWDGLNVSVEMWLRMTGDIMTVSPAYVGFNEEYLELSVEQVEVLAGLLHDAAKLASDANAAMVALGSGEQGLR